MISIMMIKAVDNNRKNDTGNQSDIMCYKTGSGNIPICIVVY